MRNNELALKQRRQFTSGVRVAVEFASYTGVTVLETLRAVLVNPRNSIMEEAQRAPIQSLLRPDGPDALAYQVLQSCGDFYDGFFIPFAVYNFALCPLDGILSRVRGRGISEKWKMRLSLGAGATAIFIAETGIWSGTSTPSLADILAGLAGVAAYAGIHYLSRKFALAATT